jgi:hypothetical protein
MVDASCCLPAPGTPRCDHHFPQRPRHCRWAFSPEYGHKLGHHFRADHGLPGQHLDDGVATVGRLPRFSADSHLLQPASAADRSSSFSLTVSIRMRAGRRILQRRNTIHAHARPAGGCPAGSHLVCEPAPRSAMPLRYRRPHPVTVETSVLRQQRVRGRGETGCGHLPAAGQWAWSCLVISRETAPAVMARSTACARCLGSPTPLATLGADAGAASVSG